MKTLISAAVFLFAAAALPAHAEQPTNPGIDGRDKSLNSPGFGVASEANGKGLGHAADRFGDNGKGNGSDPDSLGLAGDHDPGNVGGGPDTSR